MRNGESGGWSALTRARTVWARPCAWRWAGAMRRAARSGCGTWALPTRPKAPERMRRRPALRPSSATACRPCDGRGLLTPYGGFSLSSAGARDYRSGLRLELGPALRLDLEGARRETASTRPRARPDAARQGPLLTPPVRPVRPPPSRPQGRPRAGRVAAALRRSGLTTLRR